MSGRERFGRKDTRSQQAVRGTHWGAESAVRKGRREVFDVGDCVRNKKTGEEHRITGKTSWGDFILDNTEPGTCYPPDALEEAT